MGSLCCVNKNLRDPSTESNITRTTIDRKSPKVENVPVEYSWRKESDGTVTESSIFGESHRPRITYVPNMRNFKSLKKIDDITEYYTLG